MGPYDHMEENTLSYQLFSQNGKQASVELQTM